MSTDLAVFHDAPSDRLLLRQFARGDQAAFAASVERYATLVRGVCSRVLSDSHDVDDAFQAVFLVLARKASSVGWRTSIAAWLHQTALRTALRLRTRRWRRRQKETQSIVAQPAQGPADPSQTASLREMAELLDSEVARLPTALRETLLLTQVEGLGRREVAERLGISDATVKDRLERARHQLKQRLLRRGIATGSAMLAAWLTAGNVSAAQSGAVAVATASAATTFVSGTSAAGTLPGAVTLAQGVLNMLAFEKLKSVAACVCSLLMMGTLAYGMLRDEPGRFEKGICGRIVSIETDGQATVTIELEESRALLNLDIASDAKVWSAFEPAKIGDVRKHQYASLRLAGDHRTVNELHVQGTTQELKIQSITSDGAVTAVEWVDEEAVGDAKTYRLAKDAILRLGDLPARRSEIREGMVVPVELGVDGVTINAIDAPVEEQLLAEGTVKGIDTVLGNLRLETEVDDQPIVVTRQVATDALILLDDKPAKLGDIKPGSELRARAAQGNSSLLSITAKSPDAEEEKDDEREEADPAGAAEVKK